MTGLPTPAFLSVCLLTCQLSIKNNAICSKTMQKCVHWKAGNHTVGEVKGFGGWGFARSYIAVDNPFERSANRGKEKRWQ